MPCDVPFLFILLELGGRWAAAVVDDLEELGFIKKYGRKSADDQTYWIGGLDYDTLEVNDTLEANGYNEGNVLENYVHI